MDCNVKSTSVFPELVPPSGGAAAEPRSFLALLDDADFLPALAFVAGSAIMMLIFAF